MDSSMELSELEKSVEVVDLGDAKEETRQVSIYAMFIDNQYAWGYFS